MATPNQHDDRPPVRPSVLRVIAPLLRFRYPILVVAAYAFCLQHLRGTGEDWRYFVLGSELLFGQHHRYSPLPGGLHLYANYPELQIGPLSLLVATPFRLFGRTNGRIVMALVATAVAPLLVYLLERSARAWWSDRNPQSDLFMALTVLLGGFMVVQAWSPLATIYAHLDDVIVLSAATIAVWGVAHRRAWVVGIALGLAMAAKPWAVVILPLALALPRREWTKSLGVAAALAAVAWLPFLIGDPATISALRPQVVVARDSVLGLFGVPFRDAPDWVRPVQFALALAIGGVVVARGRWPAVVLVGITVRVALDPQVFLYYSAGLLLGALAWDLLRSPRPLPVWTLAGFVLLNDAYLVISSPSARAVLRLVMAIVVVAGTVVGPRLDVATRKEAPESGPANL